MFCPKPLPLLGGSNSLLQMAVFIVLWSEMFGVAIIALAVCRVIRGIETRPLYVGGGGRIGFCSTGQICEGQVSPALCHTRYLLCTLFFSDHEISLLRSPWFHYDSINRIVSPSLSPSNLHITFVIWCVDIRQWNGPCYIIAGRAQMGLIASGCSHFDACRGEVVKRRCLLPCCKAHAILPK